MRLISFFLFAMLSCHSKSSVNSFKKDSTRNYWTEMNKDTFHFTNLKSLGVISISELIAKPQQSSSTKFDKIEFKESIAKTQIYSASVGDGTINSIKSNITLITNGTEFCIIPVEDCFVISEACGLIGGHYLNRDTEYFLVYKISNFAAVLVFDSRKLGSYGLKTGYYRDDECIDYKPDRLEIKNNIDTLYFEGKLIRYCKPELDRTSNIAIDSINMQLIFLKTSDCKLSFDSAHSRFKYW